MDCKSGHYFEYGDAGTLAAGFDLTQSPAGDLGKKACTLSLLVASSNKPVTKETSCAEAPHTPGGEAVVDAQLPLAAAGLSGPLVQQEQAFGCSPVLPRHEVVDHGVDGGAEVAEHHGGHVEVLAQHGRVVVVHLGEEVPADVHLAAEREADGQVALDAQRRDVKDGGGGAALKDVVVEAAHRLPEEPGHVLPQAVQVKGQTEEDDEVRHRHAGQVEVGGGLHVLEVLDDEDGHGVARHPDDEDEDADDRDGDEGGGGEQGALVVVVVHVVLVHGLRSSSMKVHLGSGPGHAVLVNSGLNRVSVVDGEQQQQQQQQQQRENRMKW
ncbi:hypothetical protein EYF80_042171 [Liparis tanakae]|uniref:Uncharacterized protein n=1 Tax=Liparis tanakae TaxID=230148 RepID=A0A4Z2G2Y0_9TELE|nr:hypothetical protein EYF80_042171 [Liparis tanakae]